MDASMAAHWVAPMAMMMAVTMEACWADRKAALTDAMWVDQMELSTAGYSAARSVACSVASMDETMVVTMEACSVELRAASMGVTLAVPRGASTAGY